MSEFIEFLIFLENNKTNNSNATQNVIFAYMDKLFLNKEYGLIGTIFNICRREGINFSHFVDVFEY